MRGSSRGRGFINNRPTLWNPARRQCNTGLSSRASMCAPLVALASDKRRLKKRQHRGEMGKFAHADSTRILLRLSPAGIFEFHVLRLPAVAFLARMNFVNRSKWRVYSHIHSCICATCLLGVRTGCLFVSLTLDRLKRRSSKRSTALL